MQYSCGMGVSSRARQEGADRAWVLQVFDTMLEARLAEELVSVEDGLPQLVFENTGTAGASQEFIDAFYDHLGCNKDRAEKCLAGFDRLYEFPIWQKAEAGQDRYNYLSVTKGFIICSRNLVDGCFQFRVDDGSVRGKW